MDDPTPTPPPQRATNHESNGPRDLLCTVAIAFVTQCTTYYLEVDYALQTGILILTCCSAALAISRCGHGRTESFIVNLSLGFLAQSVCYHLDLSSTIRGINIAITALAMFLASYRSGSDVEDLPHGDSAKGQRGATALTIQDLNASNIWPACAALVLGITLATIFFTTKSNSKTCPVTSYQLDKTHWTVFPSGQAECDVPTQLRTIESEIDTYMHHIWEEVCRVSCIKETSRGQWAGYVSVASLGVPVDGTYCGKVPSYGDCGDGIARYRNPLH